MTKNADKLSKQTGARALNDEQPLKNLLAAHRLLGQQRSKETDFDGVADPDSLAVMGWSYGGYLTSFLVTKTSVSIMTVITSS